MKIGNIFKTGSIILLAILAFGEATSSVRTPEYQYGSQIVETGEELYSDELIRKAELELLDYLNSFPENAARDKAALLMTDIDIKSDNYNIAKGIVEEFLKNRPNSPFAPQAALKGGYIEFQNGRYKQAEYDFRRASEIAERHFSVRKDNVYREISCSAKYMEGLAVIHQGRTEDAIAVLKRCSDQCPTDKHADDAIFGQAMLYEISGEYQTAVDLYRKVVEDYPGSNVYIISRIHEANCLLVMKEPAAALAAIENAETELTNIRSGNARGKRFEAQNYADNAARRLLYLRAEASNTAGNYEKALDDLNLFIDTYHKSDMIHAVRLSKGFTLLNLKKFDQALKCYAKVIEEGDGEPQERAKLFRAVTLKRIGKPEEARRELMALSARPSFPYTGAALLELGQLYYEQADFISARRTLERARREADNSIERERIRLLLAATYTQLGQWELAAQEYAAAKKHAEDADKLEMPDRELYIAESAFGRGVALVNSRRGAEAIAELMQFMASDYSEGKEDKAVFWLAEAYYSSGMLKNAIENYRKLVDVYPASERREEALYSLGWCYYKEGRYGMSSSIFARLTKEFPDSRFAVEVWTRQGDAYYVQKQYAKSENAYRQASRLAPRTEEGQYAAFQLCDVLYRQNKNEEAITELFNFVGKYSKSNYAPNALYLIGWIRFQEGKYSEAIDNFNFMITSYPQSALVPRAHYSIADCYFNLGQFESALHSYKIIIDRYPADPLVPGAMQGIRYCYDAMDRSDEAVEIIDEYVGKNFASPFIQDFAYKKGELYYQRGKYSDAISEYQAFVEKYPDSEKGAEALYYMGKSYDRTNELDKALEVFTSIAINYPESDYAAQALLEAGLVKLKQTRIGAADSVFALLQTRYPENKAASQGGYERALLSLDNGDTLGAVKHYRQVADNFQDSEYGIQARFRLAMYYHNKDMNDSARYHLSRLVELKEEPRFAAEARYRIGMLYMRDKNFEKAVENFNLLAEKFPGIDDWYSYGLLGLGEAYTELKLYEKAIETYNVLIDWRAEDDFSHTAQERVKRLKEMLDYQETIGGEDDE